MTVHTGSAIVVSNVPLWPAYLPLPAVSGSGNHGDGVRPESVGGVSPPPPSVVLRALSLPGRLQPLLLDFADEQVGGIWHLTTCLLIFDTHQISLLKKT